MISTLDRIKSLDNSSLGAIEEQRDFVRDSLEVLRATSEITNDAFLDAGTIQGGLSPVSYTHLTLPTIYSV